jgi:hypothetical protein
MLSPGDRIIQIRFSFVHLKAKLLMGIEEFVLGNVEMEPKMNEKLDFKDFQFFKVHPNDLAVNCIGEGDVIEVLGRNEQPREEESVECNRVDKSAKRVVLNSP